jgi:glucose-6-phosphate-specific signal transduction histidine kinase
MILLYALAPRPDAAESVLALLALVLAAAGFRGLVKAKTWGVLSIGAAGVLLVSLAGADLYMGASETYALRPALAGGLLLAALAPFVVPMTRFLGRVDDGAGSGSA